MSRLVEHSNDDGRTWERIEPQPRSIVAHRVMNMAAYQVHDDGYGNLYRWRPESSTQGESSAGSPCVDPNSVVVSPPAPLATTEPSAAGGVPPAPPAAGSGLHPRADRRPSEGQDR